MGSCCLTPSLMGAAWGCVTPDLTWAALKLGTHGCFPLSLMFLTLACSGSLGVRITGLLGRICFQELVRLAKQLMVAGLDRSSKRRQVKPLAASLLEALDYDSSDDSDFKVGDASDSEGSGHGSEDASKDSGEGSCTESEENILEEEPAEEKVEEQQPKTSTEEEVPTADKEVIKTEKKEQEDEEEKPKKKKEKEKAAEADAVADEQTNEPKKWNLRRNRPLLDFVSMEELNDMDDYDSEDDNDWRPTAEKRKGKNALKKEGSDGDNEDDEDDGSGSDEDDNDEEGNEEDNSSTASDGGSKKKKSKVLNRNNADDEELTNDSLALSQSKSNEVVQPTFYNISVDKWKLLPSSYSVNFES
ncbi:PHD finger protein 14 [Turdus rufiventris]|nr:PHD finger protein 14 [Turdus rufiventris]